MLFINKVLCLYDYQPALLSAGCNYFSTYNSRLAGKVLFCFQGVNFEGELCLPCRASPVYGDFIL